MRYLSHLFVSGYEASVRFRSKLFSMLVSRAFAQFGRKTMLMLPIRLNGEERIEIGDNVYVGRDCWLQTLADKSSNSVALRIGSGTSLAGACVISAVRNVALEENVLLARNVYISDHIHKYTNRGVPVKDQGVDKIAPVLIKRGAWLGQNVVVCPGVTIGQGSVIGANSVVVRDIPDFTVAVGAPARVVKMISNPEPLFSAQSK